MAYGFNDDRSKVAVTPKSDSDAALLHEARVRADADNTISSRITEIITEELEPVMTNLYHSAIGDTTGLIELSFVTSGFDYLEILIGHAASVPDEYLRIPVSGGVATSSVSTPDLDRVSVSISDTAMTYTSGSSSARVFDVWGGKAATVGDDEIIDIRTNYDGMSFDCAGDAVRETTYRVSPCVEFEFPHNRLIIELTYNSTLGEYEHSYNCCASTSIELAADVLVKSDPSSIYDFNIHYLDDGTSSGWVNAAFVKAGRRFLIVLRKAYATFIGSDLSEYTFMTTPNGIDSIRKTLYYKIDDTIKFMGDGRATAGYIYYEDAYPDYDESNFGFIKKRTPDEQQYGRISNYIFYSDHDIQLYVSKYNNSFAYVMTDNSTEILATVNQGHSCVIPAGTDFTVYMHSDSKADDIGYNVVFSPVRHFDETANWTLPFDTTNNVKVTRIACAFMGTDGALYYISDQSTPMLNVILDGVKIVSDQVINGQVGHANSCNFANGNVYISPWLSQWKNLIYVYSVNEISHSLTYSKTITMPLDENDGATEYFVMDDERQIISVGMTTSYNAMRFSLWSIDGDEYVRSWDRIMPLAENQAAWIQGFTVVGNKIYYICGEDSSHHIGIGVFDMTNGILEFLPAMDNISSVEIEAIIPIKEDMFYDIQANGYIYLQYIKYNKSK